MLNLNSILESLDPALDDVTDWPNGIRVRGRCYITQSEPPIEYVTSVRAIVTRDRSVLVVTHPNGSHLLPGGRIESGESHEEALRRELVEETGWEVGDLHPIGFLHYHHLTPEPENYPYPYPDFLQRVFKAEAGREVGQIGPDEWELKAEWVEIEQARELDLNDVSLAFLDKITST